MTKKAFLVVLVLLVAQVIFGFIYTRLCQSAFHPIVAYVQFLLGIGMGVCGSCYWRKYIKR